MPEAKEDVVSLEQIKDSANSIISELDPMMSAIVSERIVMPLSGEAEYVDTLLYFRHPTDKSLEWTMQINNDPEYVDHELAEVIKRVFAEKSQHRDMSQSYHPEKVEALAKVRDVANAAITSLDPLMSAIVQERVVRPFDGGDEYEETMLFFSHPTDRAMEWSMQVDTDPDYVDGKLGDVVKRVYEEKLLKKQEQLEQERILREEAGADGESARDAEALSAARAALARTMEDQ